MEEKQTNLEISWDEVGAKPKESKYFSPEYDKSYQIVIESVELVRKAFKGEAMKPHAICKLKTIDGKPTTLILDTASKKILEELKRFVVGGKWTGTYIIFLLKKKRITDISGSMRTQYVFEELTTTH